MDPEPPGDAEHAPSPDIQRALVESYRRFLAFLENRLGNRALAEEVLQAAFARQLERTEPLSDAEGAIAWMFRVLRNAVIDHHRHSGAEARALEGHRREMEGASFELELKDQVCACFKALLPTLKPEYSEVLSRVDLDERPIGEVAQQLGITSNNATVRLHRARQALGKQLARSCGTCATHGCLDCTCG